MSLVKSKFNAYEKSLYEFINNVYVVCPKCGSQAIVRSTGNLNMMAGIDVKLVCATCGLNKYFSETGLKSESFKGGAGQTMPSLTLGTNMDPYFRLPLWLQMEMPDGILWAYNYEHLDFIEKHVGAELRNRGSLPLNKSIGSRLPKWMTSKKNRPEILKGIEKLRAK